MTRPPSLLGTLVLGIDAAGCLTFSTTNVFLLMLLDLDTSAGTERAKRFARRARQKNERSTLENVLRLVGAPIPSVKTKEMDSSAASISRICRWHVNEMRKMRRQYEARRRREGTRLVQMKGR